MSSDKEIIELCKIVFENIGLKRLSNKIENYLEKPNSVHVNELYDEALNWDNFSEKIKRRTFVFGNNLSLLKAFIISYQKEYDEKGRPVLIVNKLEDETASFKDNPIKNLYIIYEDEEQRDIDYEKLLLIR